MRKEKSGRQDVDDHVKAYSLTAYSKILEKLSDFICLPHT